MGGAMQYAVKQIVLREKWIGTASKNTAELEEAINAAAAEGFRLHTLSTVSSGSHGIFGGDRIQVTLVFERITQERLRNARRGKRRRRAVR